MRNAWNAVVWLVCLAVGLSADLVRAQTPSFHRAGAEFDAMRPVIVPTNNGYTIAVAEFFHHGKINSDGKNLVVVAKNKELVPFRILQLGPGDYCRVAFQPIKTQAEYDVFYGGDPPKESPPEWSARDGLLLETRQFKHCDLQKFESVRDAFNAAAPIGADYVDSVHQGTNPCSIRREPFLSRYTGRLELPKTGTYGFFTSSQDCSFLLIDDKLVASAPGRHGPAYHARPGTRHDVKLEAGMHSFEYYHAAAGDTTIMVAAWEIDPVGEKPKQPVLIPPEIFRSKAVFHVLAGNVSLRTTKLVPDFLLQIAGDVPLPDNDIPLIGVLFRNTSPKSMLMQGAKCHWDFGDGQTSDTSSANHVYLRPGLYTVTLSVRHGGTTVETANKIYVDRPPTTHQDKQYTLDDFMKSIEGYDPKTLDAVSLRQLVLVWEAKALAFEASAQEAAKKAQNGEEPAKRRTDAKKNTPRGKGGAHAKDEAVDAEHYLETAVDAGKVAFTEESEAKGDADLLKLAQWIGPMARDRLGDSETAYQIWQGAIQRIAAGESKAECEVVAADIAINDLLDAPSAKPLLDDATQRLANVKSGPAAANLQRVWGDYYAATGDGKSARKAYVEADHLVGAPRRFIEKTAWQGAHTRSAEEFIKQEEFNRAAEELQAWQRDFPAEKLDGYMTLLYARCWAGRGKYAQAVAQVEQLLTANPDSPYVDQALMVSAESDMRRGRKDRALATLHALVKDYPGSPLVPLATKNIASLEEKAEPNP